MDDFVVSSSSFTADGSTTLTGSAATTDPTTKQDFSTCLLNRAASIGIVTASGLPAKSIIDLNTIYGEINDAFKATQKSLDIAQTGLKLKTFTSRSDLDDYVTTASYPTDKLCFAIQWDQYDTSNSDEPTYGLEILTAFDKLNDPNNPQG